MMDRREIQQITVQFLEKEIEKFGSGHVFIETPKFGGRCRWTLGEALAAAKSDSDLEDSDGINPVDDVETFVKYCEERGQDWRDYFSA